jgi:hypothetical protein
MRRTMSGAPVAPPPTRKEARMLRDGDTLLTVHNAEQARAGGENVRTALVASLIAAILLTIAIAAVSTH